MCHSRVFFFSSRRRHTRFDCDWSSDVCSSDLRIRQDRVTTGGSPRMNQAKVFVGIDVAKARLDVALHPSGETWTVPNSEAGIAALVAQLQQEPGTHLVLEATGGLERSLLGAVGAAAL